MSYEMIVGLQVKDDKVYDKYRQMMMPILESFGGGFRYDFKIQETLKSQSKGPINRLFVIFFQSKESMNSFFNHPKYLEIKSTFFENSVDFTTIISEYER